MDLCLFVQEFELCAQWVQLYTALDQSRLQLQTEHLLHLLEQGHTADAFQVCRRVCMMTPTNQIMYCGSICGFYVIFDYPSIPVPQLLEALSGSVALEVSEKALDRRPGLAACHFLSDYLTLHFQSQMTPARRRHINALHLGSKVTASLVTNKNLVHLSKHL